VPIALKSPPNPSHRFTVAEIGFEAALSEVTRWADHVVEADEQGVTVNIRLLRQRGADNRSKPEGRKTAYASYASATRRNMICHPLLLP